eukprot:2949328-Heterocapsa_arctica.AAC.1
MRCRLSRQEAVLRTGRWESAPFTHVSCPASRSMLPRSMVRTPRHDNSPPMMVPRGPALRQAYSMNGLGFRV